MAEREFHSRRAIDVSHTVESGMITYRGMPAPIVCDYISREQSRHSYDEGTEFQFGKIEMVANTGTYIDSPFHRYEGRCDIAQMPMEWLVDLDCVVIRVSSQVRRIGRELFADHDVARKAVLVHTGWDKHWRTDAYFDSHPHLGEEAARDLIDRGVRLVGIDSLNIDSMATGGRPIHSLLLGHDVPIVEHLCNLAAVPESGARFTAAPVAVRGMGTFPVRAFVLV